MSPEETKRVLAKASLIDSRMVDLEVIRAWHEIIGHLDYRDAMEALTLHRRESTEYLTPAHIIAGSRRARAARETESRRCEAVEASRRHQLETSGRTTPPSWVRAFLNDYGKETREP